MSIDSITIDSILLEHAAIKHYIGVLRQAVAEQAAFLFQSADSWNRTHLKQLKENHLRLRDSLQAFREALKEHCIYEETTLSPALGKLVAKGNIIEHKTIFSYLDRAQSLLNETELLGELEPHKLMATTYNVKRTVEMTCNLVDTHETKEAGLLSLLNKGLGADDEEFVQTPESE